MKGGINLIENTSTGNDTLEMESAVVFERAIKTIVKFTEKF